MPTACRHAAIERGAVLGTATNLRPAPVGQDTAWVPHLWLGIAVDNIS